MRAALSRIGDSREAGELIACLLSDQLFYLAGALIVIDGGSEF